MFTVGHFNRVNKFETQVFIDWDVWVVSGRFEETAAPFSIGLQITQSSQNSEYLPGDMPHKSTSNTPPLMLRMSG